MREHDAPDTPLTEEGRRHWFRGILIIFLCLFLGSVLICLIFVFQNTATADFPTASPVRIEAGESLDAIGTKLEEYNYIHSPLLFKAIARYTNADTGIQAGTYTFASPLTTFELIESLRTGGNKEDNIAVTFPEGYSVRDWDTYTKNRFHESDKALLEGKEGYLFPDTYFIDETESLASLVSRMEEHYEQTVSPLRSAIEARGYTERDVIILASILEREANDEASMRMVAGILENRLNEGMPLQVDAVFEYYTGKGSRELTLDDLQTDTPYNTYTNKGLPPEPIGNPGLMAITAVLQPTLSPYLYYLTGDDGTFYYARTHEEHIRNKERYLRL